MQGNRSTNTSHADGTNNCDSTPRDCDFPNGSMTYCGPVTFGAQASSGGGITVTYGASTLCSTATPSYPEKTPSNHTWDVNFINGNSMQNDDIGGTTIVNAEDCMTWNTGAQVKLGTLSTASVPATGAYTLPTANTNAAGQYSAICVSFGGTQNSDYGNQAPLAIVV